LFAVGGFLALSFCLRFTFAFSGSGSNAVPLGLCCGSSFSSHTVRFAFFRFDPGIFCCKAVGGFLFSGSTYAFRLGGVGFVYTALALGFFVCFTLGLGSGGADPFSFCFCFASGSGLGRFKLNAGFFLGTASFFRTYAFSFGSGFCTYAFSFGGFFSGTSLLFCFSLDTFGLFAGTASFFFSSGLGFCFRFFAGFTFGLFRFTTGFGSSFFRRSALFFLTPRFFFG